MTCCKETVGAAAAVVHTEGDWQDLNYKQSYSEYRTSSLDLLCSNFLLSLIA